MHKYSAHAATDVTGFGILGHAQNLAKNQKNPVAFVIHNLPIIAKMATVAKVFYFLALCKQILQNKNCSLQRDSNLGRWTRRQTSLLQN